MEKIKTVILASRNTNFATQLQRSIDSTKRFKVLDVVVSEEDLIEFVEQCNTKGKKIDGIILTSDLATKLDDRRLEVLTDVIYTIRQNYSKITITVLANENPGHPFLAELVRLGVYNIFIKDSAEMTVENLLHAIENPKGFDTVSHLLEADRSIPWRNQVEAPNRIVIEHKNVKQSPPPQPKQKVIKAKEPKEPELQSYGFAMDRKIVVVISPFERSGSTFVSHQLAHLIAKQNIGVTYYENPFRRPYSYDRFGGHLKVPDYQSMYAQLESDMDVPRKWEVEGVSIQALNPNFETPYSEEDISIEQFLRLFLAAGETPILIVDIGADKERLLYNQLLEIASHILIVMDCDIPNLEWFEQEKESEEFMWIHKALHDKKSIFLANNYVKASSKALPSKKYIPIPTFSNEWIFNSQVEGVFATNTREALKMQNETFSDLLKTIVKESIANKKKEGFNIRNLIPQLIRNE